MKKPNDAVNDELHAMLENLELPEVQMPAHQRRLREILLASGCLEKEGDFSSARPKISGVISKMRPQAWKLVASFVMVFLAVGVYMTFFTVPLAVASLTLQVNPAVTLTLSGRNTVIGAEGLDAQGEALLARLDVEGKDMQAALRTIAGALHEAGLLVPTQKITVALYAIEEGVPFEERLRSPEMYTLAENVRQALFGYTMEKGLPVEVKVYEVTAGLAATAHAIGLLPADYVDFMSATGYPLTKELLNLQKELGIDPALFKEELDTIEAAMLDMREAGIEAQPDILAIFRRAFAADSKLEELTAITAAVIDLHKAGAAQEDIMALFNLLEELTAAGMDRALLLGELTAITAAMIDLTEAGLSKEEALGRIRAAVKADPALQYFDDLLELPRKEEAGEAAEVGKPETDKREPGKPERIRPELPDEPERDKAEPGKPEKDKPENAKPDPPDKPEKDKPEKDRPMPPEKPEAGPPGEEDDGTEPGKPEPDEPDNISCAFGR